MKKMIFFGCISMIILLSFVSAQCTDSDGGKNYFVRGEISVFGDIREDVCVASGGVFYVQEYFCQNGFDQFESYLCPGNCVDGACTGEAPAPGCIENWDCTDWSECQANSKKTRTCTDSNNCGTTSNQPIEEDDCSYGGTCTDSDGGKDEYTKGIASISETGDSEIDYCTSEGKVNEVFCKDGKIWSTTIACSNNYVCLEGVCVQGTEDGSGTTTEQPSTTTGTKYYIKNEEVSVTRGTKINTLNIEGESIQTSLELLTRYEKVYIKTSEGNKELKILPSEAISKATKIKELEEIEIKEEGGEIVYSISGTKKAYFLFVIPLNANLEQSINVETGNLVSTKKPWWHFLALGI